jgi:hypothetical protein
MASGSNPRRTRHSVKHHHPSTSQTGTPSSLRLASIPKQAIEKAHKTLRKIISPKDDDDEIRDSLRIVRMIVNGVLEQDPELKELVASEEKYYDNVTRRGEKIFIDSLRAMAANSETQGSEAWEGLFTDGTLFYFGPSILIVYSV